MKNILNKWKKLAFIMITAGAVLFAISFLLGARGGYIYFGGGGLKIIPAGDDVVIREIEIEPFDSVEIIAGSADIELVASDRYGIELRLPSGVSEPSWDITDGKLTINALSNDHIISFMDFGLMSPHYIRIYYPNSGGSTAIGGAPGEGKQGMTLKSVDLNTRSGEILLSNVSAENISLKSGSGGVRTDVSYYRHAFAQTSSGNITFNGNGDDAGLELSARSGRIIADASGCSEATVSTSSGNISLSGRTLPNAQLRVLTRSGSAGVDVSAWQTLAVEATSGNIRITGEPFGATSAISRSGDVIMTLRGIESSFSYDISTGSGSIRLGGQRLGSPARSVTGETGKMINARASSGNIRVDFN